MLEILSHSVSFKQTLKYFIYILACSLLFIALAKSFNKSSAPIEVTSLEWEKRVNVYFGSEKAGSSMDCNIVAPVQRMVLNAETLGPGALEKLLLGPSQGERTVGYFTSINEGVLIQKFEIKDGVAYVDFSSRLNEGVAGSCRVQAIRSQIEKTLTELPDIQSVVISINGKQEGILEP